MKICLIIFSIVTIFATLSATDYCERNCFINEVLVDHIACNNDQKFSINCPKDVQVLGDSLNAYILQEHNRRRNLVAGGVNTTFSPACRMATMQWDNEVAANAVLKSKKCSADPEYCHGTDTFPIPSHFSMEFYVAHITVEEAIKARLASILDSDMKERYKIDLYGERNTHVGCGVSFGTANFVAKDGEKVLQIWLTCNYPISNDVPYETCTTPGEKCRSGVNPSYPNLCSTDESY